MEVEFGLEARREYRAMPEAERRAMRSAVEKLMAAGDRLSYPHCSAVQGAHGLRELRPHSGRSAWRAFYRRIGDRMVIGAFGAEAQADPRGFRRAVDDATRRLGVLETSNSEG